MIAPIGSDPLVEAVFFGSDGGDGDGGGDGGDGEGGDGGGGGGDGGGRGNGMHTGGWAVPEHATR